MKTTLGAAALVLMLGCGSEPKDGPELSGTAKEDKGDGSMSGRVVRKVDISKDGDGVGVLHVGLSDECLSSQGTAPTLVATLTLANADLRSDDEKVTFEIDGLADGTYYASAWFDDVENEEQDEDLPGKGDLAMFNKATPICEEVVIKDGKRVDDVELALNYEMPFDLTGTMGDEGVLTEGDGGTVDPSEIDYDDPNTYTVSFDLTRSVAPAQGGDGKGIAVMALSDICFEGGGEPPPPLYAIQVPDVDLSKDGAKATLTFEGVKNGIYQLNGYLDDVGMHTDERPLPSTGDFVRFGGFGPGCVEVVVNGGDATATYDLNFVMTWDLNG